MSIQDEIASRTVKIKGQWHAITDEGYQRLNGNGEVMEIVDMATVPCESEREAREIAEHCIREEREDARSRYLEGLSMAYGPEQTRSDAAW